MSAQEIIEQIKELPPGERAQVAKYVVENDDSWIPAESKQGMADIAAGQVVDLDAALNEPYPGDKQAMAPARPRPFGAVGAGSYLKR
jgi:hypothetical protein